MRSLHVTLALLPLSFVISACAPVTEVKEDAAQIGADVAVVAFSVRTSALTEYDELLTPSRILFSGSDSRSVVGSKLDADESGVAYVLYQIPESGIVFDEVILGIRPGFRTTLPGPEIPLEPGRVTYLGRLEVQDFRFDLSEDNTTYTPTHVKLAFTDRSADDLAALAERYALLRDQEAKNDVLSLWNNVEFVPLLRQVRGNARVQDANRSPDMIEVPPLPPPPPGRNN